MIHRFHTRSLDPFNRKPQGTIIVLTLLGRIYIPYAKVRQ